MRRSSLLRRCGASASMWLVLAKMCVDLYSDLCACAVAQGKQQRIYCVYCAPCVGCGASPVSTCIYDVIVTRYSLCALLSSRSAVPAGNSGPRTFIPILLHILPRPKAHNLLRHFSSAKPALLCPNLSGLGEGEFGYLNRKRREASGRGSMYTRL